MMDWFEHNYPYTNFHELNLDWILSKMRWLVADYTDFKKYMTEGWDAIRNDWEAMRQYILDYFENLDLQEEVNNYFNELIESGEIIEVLRKAVEGDLVNDSFYQTYAQVLPTENRVFDSGKYAQGFCIGTENGRTLFCNCFTDGTAEGESNVIVFTWQDTGVIKGRYTIKSGHCNSVCFNGETYVIACGGGNSTLKQLVEINSDGDIIGRHTYEQTPWAIAYNNGKYYVLESDNHLVVLNEDFEQIEQYNMHYINGYTYQGMWADDLYLYIPCGNTRVLTANKNRNIIQVFYHDGTLYKNIECYYPLEIEEADIVDDVCYMASLTQDCAMIVIADLYKSTASGFLGMWDESHANTLTYNMYIDETYTGFLMDGTQAHPYTSLQWFLPLVPPNITALKLHIMSDCPTHPITTMSPLSYNVTVEGYNHKVLRVNYVSPNFINLKNLIVLGENDKSSVFITSERVLMGNVTIGEESTEVVPYRNLEIRGNIELSNVTINSDVTDAFMYIVGNGYFGGCHANVEAINKIYLAGVIKIDAGFPLAKIQHANYNNVTYRLITTATFDIDIAELYYPCILSVIPNSVNITNAPEGWNATNINAIIVDYIASNKSLVTLIKVDGTVTQVYNHVTT